MQAGSQYAKFDKRGLKNEYISLRETTSNFKAVRENYINMYKSFQIPKIIR